MRRTVRVSPTRVAGARGPGRGAIRGGLRPRSAAALLPGAIRGRLRPRRWAASLFLAGAMAATATATATPTAATAQQPRARDLGVPFEGARRAPSTRSPTSPGVEVGHATLVRGIGRPVVIGEGPVRTGVTAVWPQRTGGAGSGLRGVVHPER